MNGRDDKQALGSAPTMVDTRPSATPFETAGTAVATPPTALESARTDVATTPSPFESARTQATPSEPAAPANSSGIALRPFGPYTRVETLGQQGNMGVVARGYNHAFGRWELLKFLKPELAHDGELFRQFRREGRALARLSHPNVVQVFAMYDLDQQPCIAMEFLEGQSLSTELTQAGGRLSQDRAQELLLDAARGLSAAHELGLLHRDIKPDNLFVTSPGKGRVAGLKLIDFGLATADKGRPEELQKDPTLASDATGGTPLFLAPEIWQGRDPSPLTDLYALGISFYFAVTGRYPFKDTALHSVVAYCGSAEPAPSVAVERPDLSAAFVTLLDRLVDKQASKRWESADKLVAELVAQRVRARPRRVPGAGPYRGLSAYSESERDVFFGRERDIAEITERLRTQLGLILVGPVACGKTSLARAGVLPAIREGVLGGGHTFETLVLEARALPLRALAAGLAPLLQLPEAELHTELVRTPRELRSLLERKLSPERGLLLFVDQLEQLADIPAAESLPFAHALESLLEVESPRLRLLAAARSDVVDRLFVLGPLRGLLTRGFQPTGPLVDEQLVEALSEPARTAGYRFENPAIPLEIATELQASKAALPLASLALQRLWRARDEAARTLPQAAWTELGGVVGALLEHADSVWESLGAADRAPAEDVLSRLISTSGKRDVARRETLVDPASGGEAAARALERLVAARLCFEVAGEVQLVHDALATTWPVARRVLARSGVDQQLRQRISVASSQWHEQDKPPGLLWSGEQAARLLVWFQGAEQSFTLPELEFIAAVRAQTTRARRLRQVGGVAAALAAVLTCSWLVLRQGRLYAELARSQERAAAAEISHQRESAQLYADRAELRLLREPSQALADLQAAQKRAPSPQLDSFAWQAVALGVPVGLPLHVGGALALATDREYVVSVGTDALFSQRIRGTGSGRAALPVSAAGKPVTVTALALMGDAWVGSANGDVYRGRYTLPEGSSGPERLELKSFGHVPGAVRDIWRRDKVGRAFVLSEAPNELSLFEAVNGALRGAWHGPARDLALSDDAKQLAIVTLDGDAILHALDAPEGSTKPLRKGGISSVTWLGSEPAWGQSDGRVWLAASKRFSAAGPAAVQSLVAAPGGEALVTRDGAGQCAILNRALKELSRVPCSAREVRFLDTSRVVALVDAEQAVSIRSLDHGLELARFVGAGSPVTALSVTDAWLFSAAQDGGVRAYALTATLPKPLPPSEDALVSAVSATGAVGSIASEELRLRSTRESESVKVPVPSEHAVTRESMLSIGAGVAWTRGDRAYSFWDRKQLSTGQTASPIRALLALDSAPDLIVAQDAPAPENTEIVRIHQGGTEQQGTALKGRALALAELEGGGVAALMSDQQLQLIKEVGEEPRAAVNLPAGALSGALAATADGARFAVGYSSGMVAVGAGRKRDVRSYPLGSAVSCLAFGRDERVLVVGTTSGEVRALDLDTARSFPLFSSHAGPIGCGYDAARERFTFLDRYGNAWTQALDTTPLSFLPPVEDVLDVNARTLAHWRGLESLTGSP